MGAWTRRDTGCIPVLGSQGAGPAPVTGICLRLQVHQQLRDELAKVKTLEGITAVSQALKLRCQASVG